MGPSFEPRNTRLLSVILYNPSPYSLTHIFFCFSSTAPLAVLSDQHQQPTNSSRHDGFKFERPPPPALPANWITLLVTGRAITHHHIPLPSLESETSQKITDKLCPRKKAPDSYLHASKQPLAECPAVSLHPLANLLLLDSFWLCPR